MKENRKTSRPFRYNLNQILYTYTVEMMNRFKRLDIVDRVPEELWMDVHSIIQDAVTKIIPNKKKWKQAKWLSEEALQIAEKRREAKGKGERERYPTECRVSENSKKRYENLKRTVQRSRGKQQKKKD